MLLHSKQLSLELQFQLHVSTPPPPPYHLINCCSNYNITTTKKRAGSAATGVDGGQAANWFLHIKI